MNGSRPALTQAALSLASLAAGLAVLATAESLAGLPRAEWPARLSRLGNLLLAVEGLKVLSACCVLLVVRAAGAAFPAGPARFAFPVGVAGGTVLLASALAGGVAFLPDLPEPALRRGAMLLLSLSVALIGLWSLLCGIALLRDGRRFAGAAGLLFGLSSLPAYLSPLLALASFVLGLIWWVVLGRSLGGSRPLPAPAGPAPRSHPRGGRPRRR